MKELERGARLVSRALLDDCVGKGLVAVDKDLQSGMSITKVLLSCNHNGKHTASRSPRETRITSPYFLVHWAIFWIWPVCI